jgi:ABC-type uncharacterized transport system permease subunit
VTAATPPPPLDSDPEAYAPSVSRWPVFYQRAGGIVTPLLTALFAFLMGGLVVAATGHNPLDVYKAIFNGAGLNWFFQFGNYHIDVPFTNHHVWFWWNTDTNKAAAFNLTQTLITTAPLILTGLAVAFAFRCGLFNIGGQGQYTVGTIMAVFIGSRFVTMAHIPHVLLAIVLAALAGAAWAAIAGFLKAAVGAHEVITTIMLNWIAYWGGSYLFGRGGPLQNHVDASLPISDDVVPGARLSAIWGNPALQALHSGIFIALGALIAFYIILNRTTLGYQVRAVGFNPEAARSAGSSGSDTSTSRCRTSASSGSPLHCSAGTPPWASASPRCSSAPSSTASPRAASTRASFRQPSPGTSPSRSRR